VNKKRVENAKKSPQQHEHEIKRVFKADSEVLKIPNPVQKRDHQQVVSGGNLDLSLNPVNLNSDKLRNDISDDEDFVDSAPEKDLDTSKKKILKIVAENKNTDAGLEKIAEELDEDAMDNWDFQNN
jgi:hypothetical protein